MLNRAIESTSERSEIPNGDIARSICVMHHTAVLAVGIRSSSELRICSYQALYQEAQEVADASRPQSAHHVLSLHITSSVCTSIRVPHPIMNLHSRHGHSQGARGSRGYRPNYGIKHVWEERSSGKHHSILRIIVTTDSLKAVW